jgi:hypothetical protein
MFPTHELYLDGITGFTYKTQMQWLTSLQSVTIALITTKKTSHCQCPLYKSNNIGLLWPQAESLNCISHREESANSYQHSSHLHLFIASCFHGNTFCTNIISDITGYTDLSLPLPWSVMIILAQWTPLSRLVPPHHLYTQHWAALKTDASHWATMLHKTDILLSLNLYKWKFSCWTDKFWFLLFPPSDVYLERQSTFLQIHSYLLVLHV